VTSSIDAKPRRPVYVINIRANFNPYLIRNNAAGSFEDGHPNNNNNKMRSDMRLIPHIKIETFTKQK